MPSNKISSSDSPIRDASSDSTTPPSEATLADDIMGYFESGASRNVTDNQPHQQLNYARISSGVDEQKEQGLSAIKTSNEELSAAENVESTSHNIDEYENAECALLVYSRINDADGLRKLLESKLRNEIDLNLNYKGHQKQNYSWSALHLACYFGHERIVETLFSNKELCDELDINIRNSSGDTPLHKATHTNRVKIVQLLLSRGANVFLKNSDGMLAKQLTSDKHIFEMLEASEQADKNFLMQNMFKAVDNGDLKKLQEYFRDCDLLRDAPGLILETANKSDDRLDKNQSVTSAQPTSTHYGNTVLPTVDFIDQMTDERGNTLLHLAAMRGFQAICVYLLEQGFDPYKKNNLGQTCIELSSYQLRQLFMSVKPAAGRLKKLSKERVTRFEGPLLRKVRLLGWKQMYIVLENGVILLFNNRRDSMNQTRRGYKYLESASCEPDQNDLGLFTVRFSDNSRATFLVSANHLSYYTTFRLLNDNDRKSASTNQIELVRQKWVDSIRDHIIYSTEFIRKGFKLEPDDDELEGTKFDGGSLVTLNHLLPLDTIKSFVQEARAHYSILERHAESLCNLAHSISVVNQYALTSQCDANVRWTQQVPQSETDCKSTVGAATNTTSVSTGSRLLGFMRSNRQRRDGSMNEGDTSNRSQNSVNESFVRARNNSATSEFIQDNWPCLLFHLKLLMESTENTKTTMGQALALMEHQEQLRQNRIQDREERCRVLEDSLQTLARDHHELEKSISMSQIYNSGCRSISMSTDINEYHDAFEDFDDEKTVTPNSLSSDEELDKRIQDVMNEEEQRFKADKTVYTSEEENEGDDDDLESNCSALTVETITDQYLSAADATESFVQKKPEHKTNSPWRCRFDKSESNARELMPCQASSDNIEKVCSMFEALSSSLAV